MANKIKIETTITLTGANVSVKMAGSTTLDQIGSAYCEEVQIAPFAAAAALDIPDSIGEGDLALLVIKNLAPVAEDVDGVPLAHGSQPFINVATDDAMANKILTVDPGHSTPLQPPEGTVGLWIKANGAADVEIAFLAIER
jgi:hypothetical protein